MSSNTPKFAIILTPPPEDQIPFQRHRQVSSQFIALHSGMPSSLLLEARLEEHRKVMEEKKQWEELLKHRRLRPTSLEYDLRYLSPLSAARSRKSRRSRPRGSRRRALAATVDGDKLVAGQNTDVPVNNGDGSRSGGEVRQVSAVRGENVGQRPRDNGESYESQQIRKPREHMSSAAVVEVQRFSTPTHKAYGGVGTSEMSTLPEVGEGSVAYHPRLASAEQSAAQGAETAIASSIARKQPPRPRYIRKVWRPTLIRQVIICRIYFKRRATTNEDSPGDKTSTIPRNPEDLVVSHQEPNIPQVFAGGNAVVASKPKRTIKAIYPEPSKEDERNDRGGFSRRFEGIESVLFGDMEVRRSGQGVLFGSQMNESVDNSLNTLETVVFDTTTVQACVKEGATVVEGASQGVEDTTTNEQTVVEQNVTETDGCECPSIHDSMNNESSDFITVNETREFGEPDFFVDAVKERSASDLGFHITDPVISPVSCTASQNHITSPAKGCDKSGYGIASSKIAPANKRCPVRPALTRTTATAFHPIPVSAEHELGNINAPDRNHVTEKCEVVEDTGALASQAHPVPPTPKSTTPSNPHSHSYTTILETEDVRHSSSDDRVADPDILPPSRGTTERLPSTSSEKNSPIGLVSSRLKKIGFLNLFSKSRRVASPPTEQNNHRGAVGSNGSESATNGRNLPATGLPKKGLRSALKHLLKKQVNSMARYSWAASSFGNDVMFVSHI